MAVDALTTSINTQSNKFVQVFSSKVKQQSKCFITTKWTADNVHSTVKCYCQSNFGYVKKQYVNFSLQLYCLLDEVKIDVALGFHTGRRKRKACLTGKMAKRMCIGNLKWGKNNGGIFSRKWMNGVTEKSGKENLQAGEDKKEEALKTRSFLKDCSIFVE